MDPIGDRTLQLLQAAMQVAQDRHNIIASNIANVDTPGYRAKDFNFEGVMQDTLERLERSEPNQLNSVRNHVLEEGWRVEDRTDVVWEQLDQNNVNLEKEMGKLSEASGKYKLAARLLAMKYKLIRDQISAR